MLRHSQDQATFGNPKLPDAPENEVKYFRKEDNFVARKAET